jgi:endoglucanase
VVESDFNPPLDIVGTEFVDAAGKIVQLKGFAVTDPIYQTEELIKHYKTEWKAQFIRMILITERFWFVDSAIQEGYMKATGRMVEWCRQNKIYVVFDGWHEGGTGDTKAEIDDTKNAWHMLMPRYKNEAHVVWEVFNEPLNITWDEWVPMAEELIDIVRFYKPIVNAVVVSGIDWTQ